LKTLCIAFDWVMSPSPRKRSIGFAAPTLRLGSRLLNCANTYVSASRPTALQSTLSDFAPKPRRSSRNSVAGRTEGCVDSFGRNTPMSNSREMSEKLLLNMLSDGLRDIEKTLRKGQDTHEPDEWRRQSLGEHFEHAEEHISSFVLEGMDLGEATGEDHVAHAATRLLMYLTLRHQLRFDS